MEAVLLGELIRLRARCDVSISAIAALMARQAGMDVDEALKQLQTEISLREQHYRQSKPKGGGQFPQN